MTPTPRGDDPAPTAGRRRILFVVTEDWYFCSHRLPTARAARDLGFEVVVATKVGAHAGRIRAEGFRVIALPPLRKVGVSLGQIAALISLIRIYRRERPDIIHHIALVPTLFGSVAALLAGVPHSIATMTGLGFVFTSKGLKPRGIRAVIKPLLTWVLSRHSHDMVFQNSDDLRFFVDKGIIKPAQAHLIRGSGVDVAALRPSPEPNGPVTAIYVGRLLRSKGIEEIIAAARRLRADGVAGIRIVLVGAPDPLNPESIDAATVLAWQAEGLIEWWGFCEDIATVWSQAHIALLPSYREGLPKSLLEAAACGRAMIASDVPGCREIVLHETTGLLVPAQDGDALAAAIVRLSREPELRRTMGEAARRHVEDNFSNQIIAAEMRDLYAAILGRE